MICVADFREETTETVNATLTAPATAPAIEDAETIITTAVTTADPNEGTIDETTAGMTEGRIGREGAQDHGIVEG